MGSKGKGKAFPVEA